MQARVVRVELLEWRVRMTHQGKHLGVRDALAGGHPLAVSEAEPAGASQGVGVVAQAFARDGDGLKAAVRVFREAGHRLPVVHAPPLRARGRRAC